LAIRSAKRAPDSVDRFALTRGEEVKALLQGVEGFRAHYLTRTDKGAASVTVCDDQSGTEESNRIAADWLRQNLPKAASSPPEITAGEVVLTT
jgi:heme-degrading monooxygenase HmoA